MSIIFSQSWRDNSFYSPTTKKWNSFLWKAIVAPPKTDSVDAFHKHNSKLSATDEKYSVGITFIFVVN